jgi:hypothetical protein
MGAFDVFSGMGSSVGGIVVPILIIGCILAIIIYGLFAFGLLDGLLKRYQTTALCYEKRRGNLVFVGADKLNAETVGGKLTYKFKARKHIRINVPNLNFLDLVKGKNFLHMYISGRLEAHPIDLRIYTARNFREDAYNNYKSLFSREPETVKEALEAFNLVDIKDQYLKTLLKDREPETLEELETWIDERNRVETIQFMPIVNEAQLNLLAEQIAADKSTYATGWDKYKELMPIIGPVVFVFAFGIGLFLTFGKIDELIQTLQQFVVSVPEAASGGAQTVKDVIPVEMP